MSRNAPEFQPGAMLHEVIVGAFRARGTTFEGWCKENGISPANGRQATFGQSRGKVGSAILDRIIEEAGREFIRAAYFRRLDEHHRQFKKGAA